MRKTCKDENVIGAPDGDAAIPGFYSPAIPILDCGEGGTVHCLISYTILKTILKKENVHMPTFIITVGAYRTTNVNFKDFDVNFFNFFDEFNEKGT